MICIYIITHFSANFLLIYDSQSPELLVNLRVKIS